jgi:predicted aspartyl protease
MPRLDSCDGESYCVPIYIYGVGGAEDYSSNALIDTGASHTLIPRNVAEALNLPTVGHRDVQTANGYAEMPVVVAMVAVGEGDPVTCQMLVVDTDGLIAVGVDLVRQLGLLQPAPTN